MTEIGTMRATRVATDYGPVPMSRLKDESSKIFDALTAGRRVLISKRGEVVAAIDPPGPRHVELLASFATPWFEPPELTATAINQGASKAFHAVERGATLVVTRHDKVHGFLHPVTPDDLAPSRLTTDQMEERERRVSEFLAANPGASAGEIVDFTEALTDELLHAPSEPAPPLDWARGAVVVDPAFFARERLGPRALLDSLMTEAETFVEALDDAGEDAQVESKLEAALALLRSAHAHVGDLAADAPREAQAAT